MDSHCSVVPMVGTDSTMERRGVLGSSILVHRHSLSVGLDVIDNIYILPEEKNRAVDSISAQHALYTHSVIGSATPRQLRDHLTYAEVLKVRRGFRICNAVLSVPMNASNVRRLCTGTTTTTAPHGRPPNGGALLRCGWPTGVAGRHTPVGPCTSPCGKIVL
jgi:hypothetical protein